jgi:G3E family GTPase
MKRVPFSILTGFLGAGKTTVLNRILSAPQGRRIAVLVNELGRIAIDSQLIISRGGDVLELAGGCVCCKVDVKNDLWDGIVDVVRRSKPDHVVLETTGIAEPDAISEGLARQPDEHRALITEAGVVCIVDAEAGAPQLDRRDEARAQVEAADRIMLSKLDVAAPATVDALHARLRELNPDAERAGFPRDATGTAALVPWLLETRTRTRRRAGHSHSHSHLGQVTAVSFSAAEPLLAEPLLALVASLGDRLLRVKGFVNIAGDDRRSYLELAGVRTDLTVGEPWGEDVPRTEIVFIGDGIDEHALRRGLWACVAGG